MKDFAKYFFNIFDPFDLFRNMLNNNIILSTLTFLSLVIYIRKMYNKFKPDNETIIIYLSLCSKI